MPQVGEVVPLSLKLFDENNSAFVRATVKDDTGAIVVGSPFSLPNVSNGEYTLDTFLMPSGTDFVVATYRVFEDALFVTHDENYTDGIDVFSLTIPDATILDCLTQIKDTVDQILAKAPASLDITALVEDPDETLFGILETDQDTLASVIAEDESITDIIVDNDKTVGHINPDDDNLIGVVEELP